MKPTVKNWKVLQDGKCRGQLIGGHSDRLISPILSGHLSVDDFRGKILFLEGTSSVKNLDMEFQRLKHLGVFDVISGLIVGHFEGCYFCFEGHKRPLEDMISQYTFEYDFPVLKIEELGHCIENYVFPIGVEAEFDTNVMEIIIDNK